MTCATCQTTITTNGDTDNFNAWAVLCASDGQSRCGNCANDLREAERKARRAASVEG